MDDYMYGHRVIGKVQGAPILDTYGAPKEPGIQGDLAFDRNENLFVWRSKWIAVKSKLLDAIEAPDK